MQKLRGHDWLENKFPKDTEQETYWYMALDALTLFWVCSQLFPLSCNSPVVATDVSILQIRKLKPREVKCVQVSGRGRELPALGVGTVLESGR